MSLRTPAPVAGRPEVRPRRFRRWRPDGALLALYGVALLFRAAQNAEQTNVAPIGETSLHLHPSTIGVIVALSGVTTVAAALLLGRRAAPSVVRAWMGVGLAATAASCLLVATSSSVTMIGLGAALLGVGGGLTMLGLNTLVGHEAGRSAGRRLAGLTVALSVSLTLGPLADSALLRLTDNSLRTTLAVFGVLPALGLILVAVRRAKPERQAPVLDVVGEVDVRAAGGADDVVPPAMPSSLWRRPAWRLATAAQLLYQVPFVAVIAFGVVAARHLDGLSASTAQLGIAVFFVVSLLARIALTSGVRIRRPKAAVLFIAAFTAAGVIVLGLGGSAAALLVALAVLGLPHGLVYPVALGLIASETPPERLNHANAAFSACTSAVIVVVPAALGGIADVAGLRVMFLALLVPVAAIAVAVAWWPAPPVLFSGRGRRWWR